MLAVDIDCEGLGRFKEKGCETLVADITDPEARAKVADWAEGANYLVNSAGVILIKPIFELTLDDWRRVQAVNAEATFFLCQKVGPRETNSRRRDRQSVVEFGQARDDDRSCCLRGVQDHDPFHHSLLRLRPRAPRRQGQRRPAGDCRHARSEDQVLERDRRVADPRPDSEGTSRRTDEEPAARTRLVPPECAGLISYFSRMKLPT